MGTPPRADDRVDDLVAKAKIKALAWLARHNEVTVGQMITYLFMVKREHITPIVEAWRSHGASAELIQACIDRFAPKSNPPDSTEAT